VWGSLLEVWMIGGKETPNGFQWKINCGQKSLVSTKSSCIIKVLAVGNRYKLHLSPCPGAFCLIKRMGFWWRGQTNRRKMSTNDKE